MAPARRRPRRTPAAAAAALLALLLACAAPPSAAQPAAAQPAAAAAAPPLRAAPAEAAPRAGGAAAGAARRRAAEEAPAGWRIARATYYGAPERIARAYDPTRGEGSFGILAYGSCGYTNGDGSLPFPRAAYAASADANPDYPGSCGRCYQIRCKPGLVLNNQGQPIKIINNTFEGDRFRPYLPAINPNVTDEEGRPWPGNTAEAAGEQNVVCWDPSKTLTVRIADSCPCTQVLPEGAPGVAKGGEARTQSWCCAGQQHFDIAYDAFQALASPVYGVMNLEYRPVDCDSGAPLPFEPGFVSKTIYSGGARPGWSWQTYRAKDFVFSTQSAKTPGGNAATCATLTPAGGLYFHCRECDRAGYRPFEGARAVAFWLRAGNAAAAGGDAANATAAAGANATAAGAAGNATALPLKLFVRGERDNYCGAEPRLPDLAPAEEAPGGWARFVVPLGAGGFDCFDLGNMTHLEWQSTAALGADGPGSEAPFCLGDVQILE
ncbi:hypothetical protein Rsub_01831 [Raphidocelis subcapitata]|uniref:Expansin-like EG45 domain-containing protein n=1 Tax=Raphidocelis subcapitata TaxID=307507 RepID=A0A2V0NNH9_9CHLO|nr:hypothetical protein Rsub_01831 [Raphidocelis subcapitata]|eukprot:GBF89114.1 hypothetical protein Rsub_01831 [Raphidocelis subcapitata]